MYICKTHPCKELGLKAPMVLHLSHIYVMQWQEQLVANKQNIRLAGFSVFMIVFHS